MVTRKPPVAAEDLPALKDAVVVTPTRYEVCYLPPDFPAREPWMIVVERRGALWVVQRAASKRVLSADGQWEDEPFVTMRTPEWKARHYLPLEEALDQARLKAVTLKATTAPGALSAPEILAMTPEERAERRERRKRNGTRRVPGSTARRRADAG